MEDTAKLNKKPSKSEALLAEGDRIIEEFNRQHRVKASEYVTKVYDIYKRAGLAPIDAWKRIIHLSEWAQKTLEPYKPDELKNPQRVQGQENRQKQVIAVTTESGQVIDYEDDKDDEGEQREPSLKVRDSSPKDTSDTDSDVNTLMFKLDIAMTKVEKFEKENKLLLAELALKKEVEDTAGKEDLTGRLEAAEMEVKFLKGEDVGEKLIPLKGNKADGSGQFYYGLIGTTLLIRQIQGLISSGIKVVEVYMVAKK